MGDMFPIDHIPMAHRDQGRLAAAFSRMGFSVSPRAEFRSPDAPGEIWPSRGVFLEAGWFDLQAAQNQRSAVPLSCLFRAPDLEDAAKALEPFRLDRPFPLERHWDAPRRGPALSMAYANLRARAAPFMLAVIVYDTAETDVQADWRSHPNSAREVLGLGFCEAQPGPAAADIGKVLDLSGFRYGLAESTVRIRVDDLEQAAACLREGQVEFSRAGPEIHVPPFDILGCAFSFSA